MHPTTDTPSSAAFMAARWGYGATVYRPTGYVHTGFEAGAL